MPRDYKHRAQRKPKKKPVSGFLWLLAGLLLGGLIVSLMWIRGQGDSAGGEWVGAVPDRPPQGQPQPRSVEVPPPPKPRFDFYNMLPEMEVAVPEEELAERPTTQAQEAAPVDYLVQLGSFRRSEDADRLKAQLALSGFEAKVVSARINAKDVRYRVRSGPYRGKTAVKRARERLAQNGFNGIVIRSTAD